MSWINTRRAKNKIANRRRHHQQQINAAVDDRQRLAAATQWVMAEALHAGQVTAATDHLIAYASQLAEEGASHAGHYGQ